MNGPTILSTHLRKPALVDTLARARELLALERHLQAALADTELAIHCRLANLRGAILVLEADSPAWATRLRYAAPLLIQRLSAAGFPNVGEVKVRIRPLSQQAEPTRRASLSPASANHLREAARSISDAALAAALRRLAKRADSADR